MRAKLMAVLLSILYEFILLNNNTEFVPNLKVLHNF